MSVHLLKRISILTRAPPQRLFSSVRTQSDTCRFLQTFTDVNVEHCLQKWEWRDDRCFGEGGGVAYKVPTKVRHCARNAGSFSRFFRKQAPPVAICCEKSRYLGKDRYVCVPVDFEKLSEYARNAAIKTRKRKLGKSENFRKFAMGQKGSDYHTGVRYSVGTGKFTTELLMTKAPVPANKVITDNFVDKRNFVSDGGSVSFIAEPEMETVHFQDFDFSFAYQKRPAINVGAMFSQQCSSGGQPPNRGKKPEKKKEQISVNLGKPRQAERSVAARLKEPVAMACAMIKTKLKGHEPKNFGVEPKKSAPERGPIRPTKSTPAVSTPSTPKCSADKSSTAKKEAPTWNSSTYVGRKPFIQTCEPCKQLQPCRSAPAVPKWVPPVPPVSEPPKCPPPPPECPPAPPKCAPSPPRATPAPPRCLLGPPPKDPPTPASTPLNSTTCTSEPPRCTESQPCHPPPPEAKACLCHSCSKTANSKVEKKCASELKPDCKPQTEPQAPPDPNAAAGRLEGCQLSFQQLEYERIKASEEIPQLKVKTKPLSQTCSPPAVQSQSCPAKSQPCGAASTAQPKVQPYSAPAGGKASASQPCKEAAKPCSTTKNQPCGAASAAQASPSPAVKGRLSTDESKRCGTGCALQGLFPAQPDNLDAPPSCQGKQPPFSQSASRCVAEFLKKFKGECDPSQAAKQAPCPKEDPCRKDPCQADPCKKGDDPMCTIRLTFPTTNYLCKREETDPCKAAADPYGSIKKDPCKADPCKASGADPCGSTKTDPSKAGPCAAKADLCATKADPCASKVDPCAAKANSCAAKADPCAAKKAPCPKEDPCRKDPCQADPCKKDEDTICTIRLTFPTANYLCKREETDPCKAAADPCGSIKKDPCKADPCKASGADPCGSTKKDPSKAGPCAAKADLCATKADPCASKVDPCAAKANSCAAKADPCAAKKDPCAAKVDPCVVKIEPCAAKKDPCAAKVDPCAAKKDPCAAKVDSFAAKVEPCATKKDPCAVKVDPCAAKKDPCAAKVDLCAAKKDPCAAKVDSFAAKVEPCATKKDPCGVKVDPCAAKKDPCAVKVDPCAAKKDPCAAKVDPCAAKKDPCAAKVDSCAAKVDPCASKKDPCVAKENPCAAKADPCATKTDRCAAKAVPCAAKVDPSAAKADLCAAKSKSDPCIVDRCKKDDPCKASADPCRGATKSTDPCGTLKPDSCGATKAADPCGPAKAAKEDPCGSSKVDPCKTKAESSQTCGLQKVDPCKASSSPSFLPCGSEKLDIYKDKPLSCPSANLPKASSLPCGSEKLDNKDKPTSCVSANLPTADSLKADASSGSKSTCGPEKKDLKTCPSANLPTATSGSKPCQSSKDEKPSAKCSLDASSGDKKDPCSLLKRVDLKAPVKLGPDCSASKKCAVEAKGASKKDDAAAKKTIAAKGEAKIDSGPSKKTQTVDALNKDESTTKGTAKSEAKDEPKKNFHLETCSSKEGKLTCNLAEKAPGPLKPGDNLMCAKEKVEKQERLVPKDELVRSRSDCTKAKTYESVMADKLQRVADYLLKQGKKDDDDDGSGKGGGGGGTPSAPVQKEPGAKSEQKDSRCRVDSEPKKNCDPKLDHKDKMVVAIEDPLMSFAKVCLDFEDEKRRRKSKQGLLDSQLGKPETRTSQEDLLVRLRHRCFSSYEELDNVPQVINKPVSCVASAYGKQVIVPKQRKREEMGPQQLLPTIEVPCHLRQLAKNYVEVKDISQLVSKAVLPQPKIQSCTATEKRAEGDVKCAAEKECAKLEHKSTTTICHGTTAQNRVAPRKSFPMRKADEDGYIRSQPDYVHPSRLPPKPPREIPLGKVSPKSGLLEWVRGLYRSIVEALMPEKDGGSKKCLEMPPPPLARLRITGSLCLNSSFDDEYFGKRRSNEQWHYCRNFREYI